MQKRPGDSIFRAVKGALIGSGFILPGISGGALAAVFGLYERLILFMANPLKNFKANVRFFMPVGIGAVIGIFLLSFLISFMLGEIESVARWFFIGAILGTVPTLWYEAGKMGRSKWDISLVVIAGSLMLVFLWFGRPLFSTIEPSMYAWFLAGGLIGLGLLVPGLSPSNFLIYLGLYKGMSDGIKTGDLTVLVPLILGLLVIVLVLAKVMAYIFKVAYAKLFHMIFGIVMASTVMIVPVDYTGFTIWHYLFSIALLALGTWLGWWMGRLEQTVKPATM
uniref:Transmembrane protein n=1 Tax=Weissella thailandensis fsh4-2 TaxID=1056112 RepID=G0UG44_9LACO|nr:transmembrane protein [Weissella thailandensis fsh4-2]